MVKLRRNGRIEMMFMLTGFDDKMDIEVREKNVKSDSAN